MDKTTKFILGLIAVSLIGINVQMWNGKLIKDAHAEMGADISFNVCYQDKKDKNIVEIIGDRLPILWGRCN